LVQVDLQDERLATERLARRGAHVVSRYDCLI
jgi:hypothetical protein